jgi:A/G-specific adenine glycosylase
MQAKRARAQKKPSGDRAARLLGWYDANRRSLPWRAKAGTRPDPYRVWLSEMMLQQTTVAAVAAYYREFLARWPNVKALAAASLDDVLAAWAGLGYYARARNLHKTAQTVARDFGGKFPRTVEELKTLPGIGVYTAGAIAAIAFDAREAAVDANAERVLARLYAVEEPLPGAKTRLRTLGQALMPETRAGDFVQAMMDLGAGVCTPKRPDCKHCPWTDDCEARKQGVAESLPRKGAVKVRPLKRGAAFVMRDGKGDVLLVKRPEKGLLGGMLEPPLGPWTESFPSRAEALLQAPFRGDWVKRSGVVRHGFTHFELEIEVYVVEVSRRPTLSSHPPLEPAYAEASADMTLNPPKLERRRVEGGSKLSLSGSEKGISGRGSARSANPSLKSPAAAHRKISASPSRGEANSHRQEARWIPIDKLKDAALPTVMRKIIAHGLDDGGPLFAQTRLARRR